MHIFRGKRIYLRPLEISDLDTLYQLENDPHNWETTTTVNPLSRFYLEQYIISSQNNIYHDKQLRLIIAGNQHETMGVIDLFDFDAHHKRAGVGIILLPKFRGKGYATEALDLLKDYVQHKLKLKQLFCTIGKDNHKSLALFKSRGFEVTGIRKAWRLSKEMWQDEHFLQLVFD